MTNRKDKKTQNWITSTILMITGSVLLVVVTNYLNDPLWVFNNTKNPRLGFNERQQKTNLLYFSEEEYDSIIVGNSKTTYIDQNKFTNGKLFNYAVSAMSIDEYDGYINFFSKMSGTRPKNILLGIDFNNCLKTSEIHDYQNPDFYITQTTSNLYKLKHLLSYDTLAHSLRNIVMFSDKKKAVYYPNHKKVKIGFDNQKPNDYEPDLVYLSKNIDVAYKNAVYNANLTKTLGAIKQNNPNSKFYAIFLPDYMPHFTINKNQKIYNQCIRDVTNLFGSKNTYNFMKLNKITANINNYYDAAHFRDYIGNYVLEEIN